MRRLDHLDYRHKLRHWLNDDAWEPGGLRLSFKNPSISRAATRMDRGNITRMPLLVGRPCFGIPTAFLRYRRHTRFVKGRGHIPAGRCTRCNAFEACHRVVETRLRAHPAIDEAWGEWLRYDGPGAFLRPDFKGSHVRTLWAYLYRALDAHPFTSSNDAAVAAEYVRRDTEEREKDRKRKASARREARRHGVLDASDLARLEQAVKDRRGRLSTASMHPDTPPVLEQVPQASIEDLLEVWLGREVLGRQRLKPNAPGIARWIVATGRRNGSKNHAALSSRVAKDLKRIEVFEQTLWEGEPLLPPLDEKREFPAEAASDDTL